MRCSAYLVGIAHSFVAKVPIVVEYLMRACSTITTDYFCISHTQRELFVHVSLIVSNATIGLNIYLFY